MADIAVIVVAAGKSERFGGSEKKIFAKIDGRPMFLRSVELFVNREDVCQTILVVAPEDEQQVKEKFGANLGLMGIQLTVGGAMRCDSVAAGLEKINEQAKVIAIHDAARPCTAYTLIDAVFEEAPKSGAAILAAPVNGTLKRVGESKVIEETVSREGLWEAQTPQVFTRDVITEAYEKRADFDGEPTDDAQLVEFSGHPVAVVESNLTNLKVTAKGDIALASAMLKTLPKPKPKGLRNPFEEAQW